MLEYWENFMIMKNKLPSHFNNCTLNHSLSKRYKSRPIQYGTHLWSSYGAKHSTTTSWFVEVSATHDTERFCCCCCWPGSAAEAAAAPPGEGGGIGRCAVEDGVSGAGDAGA